ncbi:MAG: hypothetical protein ACXADA_22355 [Candidatus Hodarchaeales archaeon]
MRKPKIIELESKGHRIALMNPSPQTKSLLLSNTERKPINNNLERLITTCDYSSDQRLNDIGKTLSRVLNISPKESSTNQKHKAIELFISEL